MEGRPQTGRRQGRGRPQGGGRDGPYPPEGQAYPGPPLVWGPAHGGPDGYMPYQPHPQGMPVPGAYYHPHFVAPGGYGPPPQELMLAYGGPRGDAAQAQAHAHAQAQAHAQAMQQQMLAYQWQGHPYGHLGYTPVPLQALPYGEHPPPGEGGFAYYGRRAPPQPLPDGASPRLAPPPGGELPGPPHGPPPPALAPHGAWPHGALPPSPQQLQHPVFAHLRQAAARGAGPRGAPGRGGRGAPMGGRRTGQPVPRGPPSPLSPGSNGSGSVAGQLAGMSLQDGARGPGSLHSSRSNGSLAGGHPSQASPPAGAAARGGSGKLFDGETGRPLFALDIECVATGPRCHDRAAAQIGVVNGEGKTVLNVYVRPEQPVTSYITELTGLTRELLETRGVPLPEARRLFRAAVPVEGLLVGFSISSDLAWLGLTEPGQAAPEKATDREVRDCSGLFRLDPDTGRFVRKPTSQDHLVRVLLGSDPGTRHDAVGDAGKTMRLWHRYHELKAAGQLKQALDEVEAAPKQPPFNQLHPRYEGVCMGNRNHCDCKYPETPWKERRRPNGAPAAAAAAAAAAPNSGDGPAPASGSNAAANERTSNDRTPAGEAAQAAPAANGSSS